MGCSAIVLYVCGCVYVCVCGGGGGGGGGLNKGRVVWGRVGRICGDLRVYL